MQLIPSLNNTISIITINHKNQPLSVLKVMPPQWSDLDNGDHNTHGQVQLINIKKIRKLEFYIS